MYLFFISLLFRGLFFVVAFSCFVFVAVVILCTSDAINFLKDLLDPEM